MLNKGLRDEENERINNVLKQLIALTHVPENWNLSDLDNQLKMLCLTLENLVDFEAGQLIAQLEKLHFDWTNTEQFADFLKQLSTQAAYSTLKGKAVAVYHYIQTESKTFSFDIFNKINALQ